MMKGHTDSILHLKSHHSALPLSGLFQRLLRWHELYQQRQELARMSDATLHDIGLSRADVLQETERPFWDDPLKK